MQANGDDHPPPTIARAPSERALNFLVGLGIPVTADAWQFGTQPLGIDTRSGRDCLRRPGD
jgi:hypothetical protein